MERIQFYWITGKFDWTWRASHKPNNTNVSFFCVVHFEIDPLFGIRKMMSIWYSVLGKTSVVIVGSTGHLPLGIWPVSVHCFSFYTFELFNSLCLFVCFNLNPILVLFFYPPPPLRIGDYLQYAADGGCVGPSHKWPAVSGSNLPSGASVCQCLWSSQNGLFVSRQKSWRILCRPTDKMCCVLRVHSQSNRNDESTKFRLSQWHHIFPGYQSL